MEFAAAYTKFWQELSPARKMVLATALAEKVTARMMSVVVLEEKLYFQTDITFRKYQQIRSNPHVALCADNIQIEGYCQERKGSPLAMRRSPQQFKHMSRVLTKDIPPCSMKESFR